MNTASIDLYAVLGVAEAADGAAIRKAFRARIRQTHPDSRPPAEAAAAHEEMVLLNLAYETLSDPGKRAVYDLDRRSARNAKREQHRQPPPPPPPRVIVVDPEVVDFGSVFIGGMLRDQVITVRLSDNSIIRYAWALTDRRDFWQVVEPQPYRDVSSVRLRLRVRPLSAHEVPGLRSDRLKIMVDDLMAVVPVCLNVVTAPPQPPPPAPPPKPRTIVLNHRYINLGSVWTGAEAQEQVVEARFADGSPIGIARVLNTTGSFWHVVSEPVVRDTACLIICIKGGPVAPARAQGRFTERLQIHLDGVTETVGVTAFITKPPAPPLTFANWRDFRLTVLGLFMLLSVLVLLGSLLFAGAYELLNAAPWSQGHDQHPPTTYSVNLDTYCWPKVAWLPGQRSASGLSGRRIHAPQAAFTWSCGRHGPKLT
ncbi:J domain-containing protein [Streptomyces sp. NBC_00461]|uniref:J domain-containing protein n=1 Tax=Streptomyces sp. NBC_00461 TaxID=2975750 RepID=UPI002E196AB5